VAARGKEQEMIPSCQIYSPAKPCKSAQARPGPSLPLLPNPNHWPPLSPSSFPMAASRRIGSSHGAASTGQSRQLPGSACEECRKRKLRCKKPVLTSGTMMMIASQLLKSTCRRQTAPTMRDLH
jgi:hypothetical protein